MDWGPGLNRRGNEKGKQSSSVQPSASWLGLQGGQLLHTSLLGSEPKSTLPSPACLLYNKEKSK